MSPVFRTLILALRVLDPGDAVRATAFRIPRRNWLWRGPYSESHVTFQPLALLELAVGFAVGVNVFVLLYKEPALRRKFGPK